MRLAATPSGTEVPVASMANVTARSGAVPVNVALLEDRRLNARLRRTILQMSEVQQDLTTHFGARSTASGPELEGHEGPS